MVSSKSHLLGEKMINHQILASAIVVGLSLGTKTIASSVFHAIVNPGWRVVVNGLWKSLNHKIGT